MSLYQVIAAVLSILPCCCCRQPDRQQLLESALAGARKYSRRGRVFVCVLQVLLAEGWTYEGHEGASPTDRHGVRAPAGDHAGPFGSAV